MLMVLVVLLSVRDDYSNIAFANSQLVSMSNRKTWPQQVQLVIGRQRKWQNKQSCLMVRNIIQTPQESGEHSFRDYFHL